MARQTRKLLSAPMLTNVYNNALNLASSRLVIILTTLVFIVLIFTVVYSYIIVPINNSLVFSEIRPLNGPFQMLNALRRIGDGMEFQYFHGIGTAAIHYPIYALFGSSLNSLVASRHFTTEILYLVGVFAVMMVGLKSWRFRLLFVILMLAVSVYPFASGFIRPMNSSLSVRMFMPILVFATLLLPFSRIKAALVGIALGLALVNSTEQGLAVVASFFSLSILMLLLKRNEVRLQLGFLLLTTAVGVVTFAVTMVLLTGGIEPALETLRYNFRSVIQDQVWYFGVPPNPFVWQFSQLLTPEFLTIFIPAVIVTLVVGIQLLRSTKRVFYDSPEFAYTVFLGYGLIAANGWIFSYTSSQLLLPLFRSTVIVIILLIARQLESRDPGSPGTQKLYRLVTAIAAVVTMFLIARSTLSVSAYMARSLLGGGTSTGTTSLVSEYWQDYENMAVTAIDQNKATDVPVIWGVYSGYLHNHYDIFNPTQEDYIIHALGDRREPYFEQFRASEPQFVEAPTSSTAYFEWLLNEDWAFYQRLVLNYEPLVTTQHSVIFMRTDQAWQEPSSECTPYQVEGETLEFPGTYVLGTTAPRVLTARLSYETENPLRRIPLIGGLPRYFVTVDHSFDTPVSLPPQEDTFTFPVVLTDDQIRNMHFEVRSLLPGATIRATEICITELSLSPENAAFLASTLSN